MLRQSAPVFAITIVYAVSNGNCVLDADENSIFSCLSVSVSLLFRIALQRVKHEMPSRNYSRCSTTTNMMMMMISSSSSSSMIIIMNIVVIDSRDEEKKKRTRKSEMSAFRKKKR
jgi:hypothetical protein